MREPGAPDGSRARDEELEVLLQRADVVEPGLPLRVQRSVDDVFG